MGVAIGPPTLFYPEEGISDQRRPMALAGPVGICTWDEIPIFCAEAAQVARTGMFINASQIRTATIYSRSQNRAIGLAVWDAGAAADGVAFLGAGSTGFLPAGVRYLSGTGFFGQNVTRWFGNVGAGGGPHQDFLSSRAFGLMAWATAAVTGQRQDPQSPRALLQEGITPEERDAFNNAYDEMVNRLKNENCAKIFGGTKGAAKALQRLAKVNVYFGNLGFIKATALKDGRYSYKGYEAQASKSNNHIFINTSGSFVTGEATATNFALRPDHLKIAAKNNMTVAQNGALILMHELVHVAYPKFFGKNNDDMGNWDASEANHEAVRAACFSETIKK